MKVNLRSVIILLMVLCAVGILCCAGVLVFDKIQYAQAEDAYNEIRMAAKLLSTEPSVSSGQDAERGSIGPDNSSISATDSVDFDSLKTINEDTVAWILGKGTRIDYPIVHGTDNDYYLDRLFNHKPGKTGSIFLDSRNSADLSDTNMIIYGHNMIDGSMFADITNYKTQEYYEAHPTMFLFTPGQVFAVELFAGKTIEGSIDEMPTGFEDPQDYFDYVDWLRTGSTFQSEVTVGANERIITLCTCTYEFDNARYILCGKLLPIEIPSST